MAIHNIVYLACAVEATVVFIYKLRHLRTRWSSPRVWALYATIFFPAMAMWLGAPTNYQWASRVTGVPNFMAPLIPSCLAAFAASALALALLWRYPAQTAWPRVRWILAAYALAIVAMVVLFSVSSVPEEHPVNFVTYYATQPTIAAFLMIYYVSTLIGTASLAYWCLAWARDDDYADFPWLRRGLRLYGATGLVVAVFALVQIVIVSANWFGVHALDTVSRAAPVVTALVGSFLLTAAFVVPVWGPRLPVMRRWVSRWRVFPVLRSLHRALRHIDPAVVFVVRGKRLNPHHRMRRMMIELSDWRWALAPLFDPTVGAAADRLGREAGLAGEELKATVEAAQLKAASCAWHHGVRTAEGTSADPHDDDAQDGTDIDVEFTWWVQVARAFKASPVVASALIQARTPAVKDRHDLSSRDGVPIPRRSA